MKLAQLLSCAALAVTLPALHAQSPTTPITENSTSSAEATPVPNTPDGFTILNGRVYFIRSGQMMPLDREVVLRISPNGTITAFDGRTYAIPQGQVLTMAAGVTALPAGQGAPSTTGAAANSATGGATETGAAATIQGGAFTGTAGSSSSVRRDRGVSNGNLEIFALPGADGIVAPGVALPVDRLPAGAATNPNSAVGTTTNPAANTNTNGRRPLAGETRNGVNQPNPTTNENATNGANPNGANNAPNSPNGATNTQPNANPAAPNTAPGTNNGAGTRGTGTAPRNGGSTNGTGTGSGSGGSGGASGGSGAGSTGGGGAAR